MYHEGTGINFYTANSKRRGEAIHKGWKTLGKAGYVFDRKMPDTVPLYMAVNDLGAGAFFVYTTNFDEVLKLTQKKGWWTEGNGIVCYVASTQLPGTRPLYRLHRPDISSIGRYDNFYTTSVAERDTAISQWQYTLVGKEGYVWPTPTTLNSTGGSMTDFAAGKGLLKLPDLLLQSTSISGGKISWCIQNGGQGYAGASRLLLFAFSTRRVLEPKIPPIRPGLTSCGEVLFSAADIKDGVKFTVDSDNNIKETNENNNTFTDGGVGAFPSPGGSP
jgi:hypothetical protein